MSSRLFGGEPTQKCCLVSSSGSSFAAVDSSAESVWRLIAAVSPTTEDCVAAGFCGSSWSFMRVSCGGSPPRLFSSPEARNLLCLPNAEHGAHRRRELQLINFFFFALLVRLLQRAGGLFSSPLIFVPVTTLLQVTTLWTCAGRRRQSLQQHCHLPAASPRHGLLPVVRGMGFVGSVHHNYEPIQQRGVDPINIVWVVPNKSWITVRENIGSCLEFLHKCAQLLQNE